MAYSSNGKDQSALSSQMTAAPARAQQYNGTYVTDTEERLRLRIAREHLHSTPPKVVFRKTA